VVRSPAGSANVRTPQSKEQLVSHNEPQVYHVVEQRDL
jgi:hypothetical protein